MDNLDELYDGGEEPEAEEPEEETPAPAVEKEEPKQEEKEPEPIRPDFLYEQRQQPQSPFPYQPQYAPPPVQQYQQQQYPPQQQQDFRVDVDSIIKDPHGTITQAARMEAARLLEEERARYLGPLAYQQQQIRHQMQEQVRFAARDATSKAEQAINNMYETVFSKDDAFRGHQGVRGRIEGFLKENYSAAREAAERGEQWAFQALQQFAHPRFAEAALAIAKLEEGYVGKTTPVSVRGHSTERARAQRSDEGPEIDPTTEQLLARRFGQGYVERYRKALRRKNSDVEFF